MSTKLSTTHACTKRPYKAEAKYYFWACDGCPYHAHGMSAYKDEEEKERIMGEVFNY